MEFQLYVMIFMFRIASRYAILCIPRMVRIQGAHEKDDNLNPTVSLDL